MVSFPQGYLLHWRPSYQSMLLFCLLLSPVLCVVCCVVVVVCRIVCCLLLLLLLCLVCCRLLLLLSAYPVRMYLCTNSDTSIIRTPVGAQAVLFMEVSLFQSFHWAHVNVGAVNGQSSGVLLKEVAALQRCPLVEVSLCTLHPEELRPICTKCLMFG